MGLSSIFKRTVSRDKSESVAVEAPVDDVQRARTRARQRLIGAAVLLAIGIVGFPLVFETQPRPIPVDIPIEIPRKENAPPLMAPPAAKPTAVGSSSALAGASDPPVVQAASDDLVTEMREPPGPAASAPELQPGPSAPPKGPPKLVAKAENAVAGSKSEPVDDGSRARALLDGKTPPAADAGRFIVQVGAFADANAAHDTRLKIERLGMKTYTQVASTPAGSRIRVRVGPFPTRDEAIKALAKARGAGLSAVVLSL